MPQPYKLFTIYAREDEVYLKELRGQLRPLELAGRITVWYDSEIRPGIEWEKAIVEKLDAADIILILVSAAYYNSVYIHDVEIKYAISRHEIGEAQVIPVIVRPCAFFDDPVISKLQALPTNGLAVTDSRFWHQRDDAWLDVVAGVKRTLDLLRDSEMEKEHAARKAALAAEKLAEQTRLDIIAAEQDANQKELAEKSKQQTKFTDIQEVEHPTEKINTNAEEGLIDVSKKDFGNLDDLLRHLTELPTEGLEQVPPQQSIKTDDQNVNQFYTAQYARDEYSKNTSFYINKLKRLLTNSLSPRHIAYGGILLGASLVILWITKAFNEKQGNINHNTTLQTDSLHIAGQQKIIPFDTIKVINYPLVFVEGDSFLMGSHDKELDRGRDECQHSVTAKSFYIGTYEVTQSQWKAMMGNNPSIFKGCDNCPVENVSWNDVQAFIAKLNMATKIQYRLPTETEWEYAAKGGKLSQNFRYAGTNMLYSVAWYDGNSKNKTHLIGTKLPNELGIYDLSGNVWEWCDDLYAPYPCDNINRRKGSYRVYRGGGFNTSAIRCRPAFRGFYSSTSHDCELGFRLVRSFPLD